jgi:hypothetical protein
LTDTRSHPLIRFAEGNPLLTMPGELVKGERKTRLVA